MVAPFKEVERNALTSQHNLICSTLMRISKVSFVVFAYNHERYIEKSLRSIEEQTVNVDELVISDDGSTDRTKEIIRAFASTSKISSIKFLDFPKNRGFINAVNECLSNTTGDIVLLQAGDDYSDRDRVQVIRRYFSAMPGIDAVYTSYAIIDSNGNRTQTVARHGVFSDPAFFIRKGAAIPPFGSAFRRNFLQKLGQVDPSLKNEDDFICMSAVLHGQGLHVLDAVTYYYRTHDHSLSAWSLNEMNNQRYLRRFEDDQRNRTRNYDVWFNLIAQSAHPRKGDLLEMLHKRLALSRAFESIGSLRLTDRLRIALKYLSILGKTDFILLTFGRLGPGLVRDLRRFKLNVR